MAKITKTAQERASEWRWSHTCSNCQNISEYYYDDLEFYVKPRSQYSWWNKLCIFFEPEYDLWDFKVRYECPSCHEKWNCGIVSSNALNEWNDIRVALLNQKDSKQPYRDR